MTTKTEAPEIATAKTPRHIQIATNHLLKQRAKAIATRDKAAKEATDLEEALTALGWSKNLAVTE
jgi:hypothetical protein